MSRAIFKADLDAYLQQRGASVRSLQQVIAYNEPTLAAIAYAFEQTSHARKPPDFAATIGARR